MALLHLWWYLCRSRLINQDTAPRISSLFRFHRGPTESSAHLVIDAGVSPIIIGKYVPYGYVEVSETVGMHEGYVLDALLKGVEVGLEGVRLFWGDELGRPFFHDYEGQLVSAR